MQTYKGKFNFICCSSEREFSTQFVTGLIDSRTLSAVYKTQLLKLFTINMPSIRSHRLKYTFLMNDRSSHRYLEKKIAKYVKGNFYRGVR